jgi:hypothetical protein
MFVYVFNCHGQPLMPCQPGEARLLLKAGKVKIIRMVPFTLQLLYGSSGYTQEVSVGVDAGTRHIGVSATTEHTVLFEAEVTPRTDIQELLATRRQFRRARRQRKTRYRPARFLNRKKPQGWLALPVGHMRASWLGESKAHNLARQGASQSIVTPKGLVCLAIGSRLREFGGVGETPPARNDLAASGRGAERVECLCDVHRFSCHDSPLHVGRFSCLVFYGACCASTVSRSPSALASGVAG